MESASNEQSGNDAPLVSIILPTFNRAHCVVRAMDSALNQTHGNVELIVVDDGSTDSTAEAIGLRYGHNRRLKYITQSTRGLAAARNRGLAEARGDFVAFMDFDDIWKPWKLEVQLAVIAQFPDVGMVWTDMEALDARGRRIDRGYLRTMFNCYSRFTMDQLFPAKHPMTEIWPLPPEALKETNVYVGDIYSRMFMGNLIHTSTVLIRRERLEKIGGFNEEIVPGDDYEFHLRVCREGPVGFIDVPAMKYREAAPYREPLRKDATSIAEDYFNAVSSIYDRDEARLNLPPALIRRRMGEIHAQFGEALLAAGEQNEARVQLQTSLRFNRLQPLAAWFLLMAMMPATMNDGLRIAHAWLKRVHREFRAALQGA